MDQNRLATHSQQSFRGNKWAVSSPDDGSKSFFKKTDEYRKSNVQMNTGGNQSVNHYHSEFSQITNVVDNGFKRMKYNQMETLNQLRQEYQILRNLPIQQQMMQSNYKKQSEGSLKESVSSESKKSRKPSQRQSYGKQAHMLSLEKRQLQTVIGNSMKKIQQLLNNEVEYKKVIHELQMKLDSRGSNDKLQGTVRNLRRNETQLNEKIDNLKRDIERLKQTIRQLTQRNSSLQIQISSKDQQLRRCKEDRKRYQQQLRSQKQRNSNLQIEYKKLKVEYQLLEKQKNSEINRLNKYTEEHKSQVQNLNYKIRNLQEQLNTKQAMISSLKQDIQRLRNRPQEKPKIIVQKKGNDEQLTMLQTLISHLKEESNSQNRASMDLIQSIIQGMQNKRNSPPPTPKNNDSGLLNELQNIKQQLSRLRQKRQTSGSRVQYQNNSEYLSKIATLENDLADAQLDNLKLKEDNSNLRSSYEQMQQDLDAIHKQSLELRNKLGANQNNSYYISQNLKTQFRQRQMGFEEQIRNLQKRLDEALFIADRQKKDKDHTLNLLRTENSSSIKLLQDQLSKLEREKSQLRSEMERMRAYYQGKIQEKNQLLEQMSKEKNTLIQTHQQTLLMSKDTSDKQMRDLLRKLHEMAELNDRYMRVSAQCSQYEREVHELRHLIRKFKVLNDNVEHLWMVKQAQYGNLHMMLDSIKTI